MTSETLLRVSRQLLPSEHQRMRANIPRINRLGDLSIKWRRLGEVGITLLERGEYAQAKERPLSLLAYLSISSAESSVKQQLLQVHGANERLKATVAGVDFMGNGSYLSIAYILDSAQPGTERDAITEVVDNLSGAPGVWGAFKPHISIATIPRGNAEDSILDEFWEIAPQDLTFLAARVASL